MTKTSSTSPRKNRKEPKQKTKKTSALIARSQLQNQGSRAPGHRRVELEALLLHGSAVCRPHDKLQRLRTNSCVCVFTHGRRKAPNRNIWRCGIETCDIEPNRACYHHCCYCLSLFVVIVHGCHCLLSCKLFVYDFCVMIINTIIIVISRILLLPPFQGCTTRPYFPSKNQERHEKLALPLSSVQLSTRERGMEVLDSSARLVVCFTLFNVPSPNKLSESDVVKYPGGQQQSNA